MRILMGEAADRMKVTKQAVYIAIRKGRIQAEKVGGVWMVPEEEVDRYRSQRFSRRYLTHNGEIIHCPEKGKYSPQQVANILCVPRQKIYYALRVGYIKADRLGSAWVISSDAMHKFAENYLSIKLIKKESIA